MDDQHRTTPKSSRRESQELSQIGAIAGADGPLFFPDRGRRRRTDTFARRDADALSLGTKLSDEGGDAVHRGVDHGEQPVPDAGKGDKLRLRQPADRCFEQLETSEGVGFA
jgi:hypothetical protein